MEFRIQRRFRSGAYEPLATVGVNTTGYVEAGLAKGGGGGRTAAPFWTLDLRSIFG